MEKLILTDVTGARWTRSTSARRATSWTASAPSSRSPTGRIRPRSKGTWCRRSRERTRPLRRRSRQKERRPASSSIGRRPPVIQSRFINQCLPTTPTDFSLSVAHVVQWNSLNVTLLQPVSEWDLVIHMSLAPFGHSIQSNGDTVTVSKLAQPRIRLINRISLYLHTWCWPLLSPQNQYRMVRLYLVFINCRFLHSTK